MTTGAAPHSDDPYQLLSGARELAQRVRRAQRATWFPLLVLAAVTFAAILVNRYGGHPVRTCATFPGGKVCAVYSNAEFIYWPIALVLAYVAIAAFSIRRARAQGIETRVRPYAIAGIIIAVAVAGAAFWQAHHPVDDLRLAGPGGLPLLLARPGTAIGLALLVLAWSERNRALLLLTLVYLAVTLLRIGNIATHHVYSPWDFLPLALQGGVLLLGGIGFALAQRPLRAVAP
jgi:hypothetical protein